MKQTSEEIAVAALTFVAGDPALLNRFLAISGINPGQIRAAASEPGFLAGVLQFIAAHEPTLLGFLPLHHLVLLEAGRILPHLEDYAAAVAAMGEPPPRTASLITGASGTTDIEGSYVRGAHGPRFVHILLLDEAG